MSDTAFANLLQRCNQANEIPQHIATILSAARTNWFTADQATTLVKAFGDMNYRIEPARALAEKLVDRENLYKLQAVLPSGAQLH